MSHFQDGLTIDVFVNHSSLEMIISLITTRHSICNQDVFLSKTLSPKILTPIYSLGEAYISTKSTRSYFMEELIRMLFVQGREE